MPGFFWGKGKISRTCARPREEKAPPFLFVCFPLHALYNKLTQLTSPCHVLYEIEFYMNQTNFEFCQLLLFFYYSLKIFILSFIWERQKIRDALIKDNFPLCRGEGVGEEGRHFGGMNGIRHRPFFKLASRQNFLLFSGWIAVHYFSGHFVKLSVDSARVSFFFCLKKENSNTRKLRNNFPSSRWESNSRPSEF